MEIVFLLILFAFGNLLKSTAEKKRREQAGRELDLDHEEAPDRDDLMEEIRRAMEGMRQQRQGDAGVSKGYGAGAARLPAPARDDDGFEEDDESLEEVPVIRSLEDDFTRPERELVDHDSESEALIRQRIAWAEERARAHRPEDHAAFDRRIRSEPPVAQSAKPANEDRPDLRRLIVWQEILGKPVALRDRHDA